MLAFIFINLSLSMELRKIQNPEALCLDGSKGVINNIMISHIILEKVQDRILTNILSFLREVDFLKDLREEKS